jgi:hypothetical protein
MSRHSFGQGARRCIFVVCLFSSLFCSGSVWAAHNVEVIVNPTLYAGGQITDSLNQYLGDLRSQGYTPHLTTSFFKAPSLLRSYLATQYSTNSIEGAIMIGNLPIEHFERNGQFGNPDDYQRFACDLYYMDINGTWTDSTSNGTYDTHSGDVNPEIWVSHMITSPLTGLHDGRTETSLLNSYFAKTHQYRQGQLRMPQNGLAYIDDDWSGSAGWWGSNLGASVAGHVDVVSDVTKTTAADYTSRLAPATSPKYESVLLACHSGPDGHAFKTNYEWTGGNVYNSDLAGLNPQALFYNLFACSNSNYEATGYMGGEYVFGTDLGLLSVSTTKTGSMLNFEDYYTPLGQGASFGQAYLDWWQAQAAGGFEDWEKDWFYGMTLTGDPLLKTQAFSIPEPSACVLIVIGSLLGWFGRRRLRRLV